MTSYLPAGAVLGDRFTIESPVGEGGMAVVYRARDLTTSEQVAVKLLRADRKSEFAVDRFGIEAEIVASLNHPHIVGYVTHGHAPGGEPFLVLEWLEGEDLARRLNRGPLRVSEALRIVALVADALRAPHERGIVHRDLKPSNLFLRQNQVEQVTVLDFGVARGLAAPGALTQSGVIVGTPEYMAPEQVSGDRDLGPAADIFSLGCVLYECLTGRSPFAGGHLLAVLAKILFEEPTDIRVIRPGIPPEVVALLAHMLAKEPARRLRDGTALGSAMVELLALEDVDAELVVTPTLIEARPSVLRGELQELLSVVVARGAGAKRDDDDTVQIVSGELLAEGQFDLLEALRAMGAHAAYLLDGSLVAVLRQCVSAVDQAILAVQAALLIRERWSDAHIAVATGRGARPGEVPMGEALDRAARLLAVDTSTGDGDSAVGEVRLDELTSSLVASHFDVQIRSGGALLLRGARAALDESRPLLGKPTPCVGRERELTHLLAALASTVDEPHAQAVIIVGPPGSGKSRLRHEFMRRVSALHPEVLVLLGRGAPLSKGAAFGLLGQALRGLAGVHEAESQEERRSRFFARIGEHLAPERARRVAPFLAEVSQIDGDDQDSGEVRAARQDPGVMHQQVTRAFVELLGAECAAHPVMLILEDLHWGDAPTVGLLDAALRELNELPLLVVALARLEVWEQFPGLWQQRRRQEIGLPGLGRRACERLIRDVLGAGVTPERLARIIDQSQGNALFLEELIRATAEGKTESIPGTVLAMLQARLGRLPPGARRVLCAASVFGSVFCNNTPLVRRYLYACQVPKPLRSPCKPGPFAAWMAVPWPALGARPGGAVGAGTAGPFGEPSGVGARDRAGGGQRDPDRGHRSGDSRAPARGGHPFEPPGRARRRGRSGEGVTVYNRPPRAWRGRASGPRFTDPDGAGIAAKL
jgi:eukaryotic-like serine/threonine-protein kinase